MVLVKSRDNTRKALLASFCFYAALGFAAVCWHWGSLQNPGGRGAILIILVGLLHLAGYSLYRDQQGWERLRSILWSIFPQQCAIVFLSSFILISGLMQYVGAIAGAYWAMVAVIVARRPRLTGRGDKFAVCHGFAGMFWFGLVVVYVIRWLQ